MSRTTVDVDDELVNFAKAARKRFYELLGEGREPHRVRYRCADLPVQIADMAYRVGGGP